MEHDHKKLIAEALDEYFNPPEKDSPRKFFDATQIPRICEDIRGIKKDLSLIKLLVFGAVGIILAAWVMNTIQ